MPFDIVWIDNFKFWQNEDESRKILDLKNLIWRAWRTKSDEVKFDYWYVIIENRNKDTFIGRITWETTISPKSKLEDKIEDVPIDLMDVYESFKESWFDDNLFLPLKQVDRIKKANIDIHIEYILNNLLNDEWKPLKWKEYQKDIDRKKKIKESFKEIYLSHLRRDDLSIWEKSILSASIPMLLWRIQWKVFREIVWLRKAYITKKDERREIERKVNSGEVDYKEWKKLMDEIILEFSQKASWLPDDTKKWRFPLFKWNLKDFKYDLLVYDTYDYLDKVITFSLINPISAVFQLYYEKTQDYRAKIIENYIRYWTNDEKEILLLRYWYIFEEIEKIKKYVVEINEDEIIFEENIKDSEVIELIDRYL
jgi:hypothetical protein